MATRILPGVYTSLNDLSQIPEGQTSLTVGYVLAAEKGKVNEARLVTSVSDFMAKYTFSGIPALNADPTYHDIVRVLAQTNQMYVVRAADNPSYGTAMVQPSTYFGKVISSNSESNQVVIEGKHEGIVEGSQLMFAGNGNFKGYFVVNNVTTTANTTTVTVDNALDVTCRYDVVAMTVIAPSYETPETTYSVTVAGDLTTVFAQGDKFTVSGCSVADNNKEYTVKSVSLDGENTVIMVEEELETASNGHIWTEEIAAFAAPVYGNGGTENPQGADLGDNLFLIAGVDPGAYNDKIGITIETSVDYPQNFVYYKGADLGTGVPCSFDTARLNVINTDDGTVLETFLFSRDPEAKTIDGVSLFIEDVISGSNFIQVVNNANSIDLPTSTYTGAVRLAGGDNGGEVTPSVLVAALNAYATKTIPVSILACGSSVGQESSVFQQALLEVAVTRKDAVAFLNSPATAENATVPSVRAQNIVDYKKNDLASVSFYGTMYAPHVKSTDIFNGRQVKLGSASTAVAGWLRVINTLNYPYAFAGPQNGQVTGVTCDWKIGDESGEAQLLNDASVNYIAFDAKVGRYYMQCQNTLQIANSSMRNLGAVLNVLDIKEHFQTMLKEYLNLPITSVLRRDIIDKANDYLEPMIGVRFYNATFQDVSSALDIADNTLRYLITISVTQYAQKIYLIMNIVNSTYNFSILQSM